MVEKAGTNIEDTLAEREVQHGPFADHANIEVYLKRICSLHSEHLTDIQVCGLGMIMHKIARILNRGNNHSDTWHDIAGYATLVEQSILDE
jgi:hypothetical protein